VYAALSGRSSTRRGSGMPKGVVRFFNDRKGYGFIESDKRDTVFVHFSAISQIGYKTLKEGEEVWFDIRESQRGLEAFNVRKA